MKQLLSAAGIGVSAFAKLAGISRVTASLWVNGHTKPHALHAARIEELLARIRQRVSTCELPLPPGPVATRDARLRAVVFCEPIPASDPS